MERTPERSDRDNWQLSREKKRDKLISLLGFDPRGEREINWQAIPEALRHEVIVLKIQEGIVRNYLPTLYQGSYADMFKQGKKISFSETEFNRIAAYIDYPFYDLQQRNMIPSDLVILQKANNISERDSSLISDGIRTYCEDPNGGMPEDPEYPGNSENK